MQSEKQGVSLLVFLGGASIVGAIVFFAARQFHVYSLWFVVFCVFLLSIPIILSGLYVSTVRQVHRLAFFATGGRLYRLFSRRLLTVIGWVIWALMTSFLMLLQLNLFTTLEWIAFFLAFPLYWLVFTALRRVFSKEVRKPYIVTGMSIEWTRRVAPVVMLLMFGLLVWCLGGSPAHITLQEAITANRIHLVAHSGSAVVEEALQIYTAVAGIKDFAYGKLDELPWLVPWLLNVIGGLVVFYNVCAMLSCLMIPTAEYRRVFGPLSDETQPPAVLHARIAATAAVVTFVTFFVYVPLFVVLETWIRLSPDWVTTREKIEALIITKVDEIDGLLYKRGTIAQIEAARIKALNSIATAVADLEGKIDQGFLKTEGNVDGYLDWYYSLPAEYARIGNALVGNLESYMAERLAEHLYKGDPFKDVEAAIKGAINANENASKEYQAALQKLLGDNRIDVSRIPVETVRRMSRTDAWTLPEHPGVITLKDRMAGSAAAAASGGVVSALVAKKIVGKVLGKSLFKVAAKAVSKVIVGKLASAAPGAAAGAAAGAAVGTFILPVIGTAIGAAVGGFLGGVLAGVTVDKGLLMLEEQVSRAEFKREIISSIAEAKMEFKKELLGDSFSKPTPARQ